MNNKSVVTVYLLLQVRFSTVKVKRMFYSKISARFPRFKRHWIVRHENFNNFLISLDLDQAGSIIRAAYTRNATICENRRL